MMTQKDNQKKDQNPKSKWGDVDIQLRKKIKKGRDENGKR